MSFDPHLEPLLRSHPKQHHPSKGSLERPDVTEKSVSMLYSDIPTFKLTYRSACRAAALLGYEYARGISELLKYRLGSNKTAGGNPI